MKTPNQKTLKLTSTEDDLLWAFRGETTLSPSAAGAEWRSDALDRALKGLAKKGVIESYFGDLREDVKLTDLGVRLIRQRDLGGAS